METSRDHAPKHPRRPAPGPRRLAVGPAIRPGDRRRAGTVCRRGGGGVCGPGHRRARSSRPDAARTGSPVRGEMFQRRLSARREDRGTLRQGLPVRLPVEEDGGEVLEVPRHGQRDGHRRRGAAVPRLLLRFGVVPGSLTRPRAAGVRGLRAPPPRGRLTGPVAASTSSRSRYR